MFEALKAHPHLYVIVLMLTYCAGGATMFVAICHYVYLQDVKRNKTHECHIHPSQRTDFDKHVDDVAALFDDNISNFYRP